MKVNKNCYNRKYPINCLTLLKLLTEKKSTVEHIFIPLRIFGLKRNKEKILKGKR